MLGIEEERGGRLLPARAEGTQGKATGALCEYGAQCGLGSLGAQQGCLALHTCGTETHETDGDG